MGYDAQEFRFFLSAESRRATRAAWPEHTRPGPATHPAAGAGRQGASRSQRAAFTCAAACATRGPSVTAPAGNDRDETRHRGARLLPSPRAAAAGPRGRNLNSRPTESHYGTLGHTARKRGAFFPAPTTAAPPAKNKRTRGRRPGTVARLDVIWPRTAVAGGDAGQAAPGAREPKKVGPRSRHGRPGGREGGRTEGRRPSGYLPRCPE